MIWVLNVREGGKWAKDADGRSKRMGEANEAKEGKISSSTFEALF